MTFCLLRLTGKVLVPVQSKLTLTVSPSRYSCTIKASLASSASILAMAPSTCEASLTTLKPLHPTPSVGLKTIGKSNLRTIASLTYCATLTRNVLGVFSLLALSVSYKTVLSDTA